MTPVFKTTDPKCFRGWYCPKCRHFDYAIGRERKFTEGAVADKPCPKCEGGEIERLCAKGGAD